MQQATQQKVPTGALTVLQQLQAASPAEIPDLDFVRQKYVTNYNASHREKVGELMYHRNVVHFKQAIMQSSNLQKADKFSLYACFVTAAVNGYSMDPADGEIYLIPRDGKAMLDRQAGAYVRRLIRTGQIKFAEQPKLVYEGDVFEVVNGRVVNHVERFQSDRIVAGYVRMVIDDAGTDRFFIYRRSDFESWRKKSPNPRTVEKQGQYGAYLSESLWDNGQVGGENPEPNFLRTKIIKHAAKEKCWASGNTPAAVEEFTEVFAEEIDTPEGVHLQLTEQKVAPVVQIQQAPAVTQLADDAFIAPAQAPMATKVFNDDDF